MARTAGRTFLPPFDPKSMITSCQQQMEELLETLLLRVVHAPENIWYEADDVKHVVVDGRAAAEKSMGALKKLMARDATKRDDMNFLSVPCMGGVNPRVLLMEGYLWTGLCVLGYLMGAIVGDFALFTDLIQPIFHPINALVVAIFTPCWVHSRLRKAYWPDEEQRSTGFYAATLLGMMMSYAVGKPPFLFAPFVGLVPSWIGLVSGYHEIKPVVRSVFLIQCLVPPTIISFLHAYFMSDWCTFWEWNVLCAVIYIDLQLKLGRLRRRWAGKETEQWDTTVVIICAHFLLSRVVAMFAHK